MRSIVTVSSLKNFLLAIAIGLTCAFLQGCGRKPAVEITPQYKPVEVAVPVAVGCVATQGRPKAVVPLNQKIPAAEWAKRAPGAKAEAVRGQAGDRLNYEDQDRAATSTCK